jgi:hypothetical protein
LKVPDSRGYLNCLSGELISESRAQAIVWL